MELKKLKQKTEKKNGKQDFVDSDIDMDRGRRTVILFYKKPFIKKLKEEAQNQAKEMGRMQNGHKRSIFFAETTFEEFAYLNLNISSKQPRNKISQRKISRQTKQMSNGTLSSTSETWP